MDPVFIFILFIEKDWKNKNTIIVLTEEDAIELSMKYPKGRVEIFAKKDHHKGYGPTSNYYKNGNYILTNFDINS